MKTSPWLMTAVALASLGCGGSRTRTLFVDAHKAECVGEAIGLCFLVHSEPDGQPTFLYGPIHGFDYEWGTTYQVTFREEDIDGPIPQDASSIRRELLRIDDAQRVPAGTTFDLRLTTREGRVVEVEPGRFRFHSEHDFVCSSDLPCDELRALIADGATITLAMAHADTAGEPLIVRGWTPDQ